MPWNRGWPLVLLVVISVPTQLAWPGLDVWTAPGPPGASVETLVIDPSLPRRLYAGTTQGIYTSNNRGTSWSPLPTEPANLVVSELVIDPRQPARLYATQENAVILRSNDHGLNWQVIYSDPSASRVGSLRIDPKNSSRLYAASVSAGAANGVLKSVDGGVTWALKRQGLPSGPIFIRQLEIDPQRPSTLYVLLDLAGLFKSVDGGESWFRVGTGLFRVMKHLAVDPTSPRTLYATFDVPEERSIWKSADGGVRWARATTLPWTVRKVFALAGSPSTVFADTEFRLVRSRDGWLSWLVVDLESIDIGQLLASPATPETVYVSTPTTGVFRSLDLGQTWSESNLGLNHWPASDVALDPSTPGAVFAAARKKASAESVLVSREAGRAWKRLRLSDFEFRLTGRPAFGSAPLFPLYAPVGDRLLRSTYQGEAWEHTAPIPCFEISKVVFAPSDSQKLFVSGRGLSAIPCPPSAESHRSINGGLAWSPMTHHVLGVDPVDAELLYGVRGGHLERSSDDGASWTPIDAGITWHPELPIVDSLVVHPLDRQRLFAADCDRVWVSEDGGASWTAPAGAITNGCAQPFELAVDPGEPLRLYALVGPKVLSSEDGGASWQPLEPGLPANLAPSHLAIDPHHPNRLFLATSRGGIWELTRSRRSPCVADGRRLCLEGGRFAVDAYWRDFLNRRGRGQTQVLTGDTGGFWFFRPGNLELMVKALDGTGVNGRFWFFYGALSNVEYTLEVTDTTSGEARTYFNPAFRLASRGDTDAFSPRPGEVSATVSPAMESPPSTLPLGGSSCSPSSTALCLLRGRYQVEVEWEDFEGDLGVGQAVPVTADTGVFWFFHPQNLELMVKVLDGRANNGHTWVFYGSLSNVAFRVTVTDTETGERRVYENSARAFSSRADTTAF